MEIQNTPVCGGPAPRHAWRTAEKLAGFALRHTSAIRTASVPHRYLDVGCGNGFITEMVAREFGEVVGIDVERERVEDFRTHASKNCRVLYMSAAEMQFPDEYFSFITSFEVLEHVADLDASVREIVRVCAPGGVVVISVPQLWFPFENHGARFGNRTYARKIPLLPYIRALHRKCSLARVFSSGEMDHLFVPRGMELRETAYAAPQFERLGAQVGTWEATISGLRNILNRCETVPALRALVGVSMLKAYQKGIPGSASVNPSFRT